MKLYRAKDYKDMSRKAANIISAQVIMKPNCVLGRLLVLLLSEPYTEQLVEWYKGDLDFAGGKKPQTWTKVQRDFEEIMTRVIITS